MKTCLQPWLLSKLARAIPTIFLSLVQVTVLLQYFCIFNRFHKRYSNKSCLLSELTDADNAANSTANGDNLDGTRTRVNIIYQMDTGDTSKNSIIACWITNNDIDDIKSVRLNKTKIKNISKVLDCCSDWIIKAPKNLKWIRKQKLKKPKFKNLLQIVPDTHTQSCNF